VAVEVPPSRVPQRGVPPRLALALVVVGAVSMVGFAVLGKTPEAPAPSWPPAALVAPSTTPRWSPTASPRAARATPTPGPPCEPPRIAALTAPITRHPRPLVPTGVEVLTPWMGGESSLVADAKGGFWAAGSGRLVRLDANGAVTASWTFADDARFGVASIVPAREGGVWLWGGPEVARFDGKQFRDVITAPVTPSPTSWVVDIGEAPDGSLWAAVNAGPTDGPANRGALFHWDGASWTEICRPQPSVTVAHLAVDAAGNVWVGDDLPFADVSRFDGTTWSTPPSDPAWTADRGGVNAWPVSLVAADDGSLWLAFGGLGHHQAKTWTSAATDAVDLSATVSLAAAPDGSAWLATDSVSMPGDQWGPHTDTGIAVAHVDGGSWTVYDSADGLPAPQPSSWATITAVAASRETVIAATRDGFYRLAGDRWVRVGPRPAAAALAWPQKLLAVSGREAWAATDDGLWHVRNGTWTRVPVAGWKRPMRAFDVARAPDGTVAVATEKGTAILRDGRWTVLGREEARLVTIADDGAIWVGERPSDGAQTTVVSFRFDGRTWVRNALPAVETIGWPAALVGAPDGGRWLLSEGWGRELHRFDGTSWTRGSQLGEYHLGDVAGLALAPNGDLLALTSGHDQTDWAVARYDGATWSVNHASGDLPQPGSLAAPNGFAIAPDGSLWVSTGQGLAHFDGRRWSLRFAGVFFYRLSFAPDGSLWAVGPSGVQRVPADFLVEPDPADR
jgi:hypothetical protein